MKIHNPITVSWLGLVFSALGMCSLCHGIQSESNADPQNRQEKSPELPPTIATRPDTKFIRLQTDEYENPIALQTATSKYVLENDEGEVVLEVFLESVVHIADTSYYRGFQKRFERYDTVLCESVFKQEKDESTPSSRLSGLNMLQQLSSGTLGLAYESDEIDYEAGNLKHADLSPQEKSELMKERGDDQMTLIADLLAHIIKKVNIGGQENETEPQESGSDDLVDESAPGVPFTIDLKILTDPNGIMKIRRLMATVLIQSGLLESAFPPSIQKMIIGDQNDRIMSFLDKEIEEGKTRIAIFYGVGHMRDLESRLVNQYSMKLDSVNWRNAWDLRDGSIEGAPLEGLVESAFRDSFKNKMRQFARDLRNQDQSDETGNENESEKNQKIDDLEKTLKALEAKLEKMEKTENESKEKGGGKGGESEEDDESEDDGATEDDGTSEDDGAASAE